MAAHQQIEHFGLALTEARGAREIGACHAPVRRGHLRVNRFRLSRREDPVRQAEHLQLLRHPQSMRLPQDGVRHAARAMNRRRACRRVPAALDLAGREGHLSQQKSWTRCMKPSRLWDWRGWANAERSEPVGARALRPPSHQHTQLMARNVCPDAHLRDDPAFIPEYDPITASARLGPRSASRSARAHLSADMRLVMVSSVTNDFYSAQTRVGCREPCRGAPASADGALSVGRGR